MVPLGFVIAPFQERPFFPLQLGQEDNVSETLLKAEFTDLL